MRIALGFATTGAIWGVGYVSFIGPGLALGEVLFGLMLLLIGVGGFFAGRYREVTAPSTGSGFLAGAWVGFVTAVINLLIVGSVIRGNGLLETLLWLIGLFAGSMLLGGIGGALARRGPAMSRIDMPSPLAVFSIVLGLIVLMLLFSGGLVTGLEAGLAVPDWPNSFGHNMLLYPLRNWKDGIFFEHAHRLLGMLVGTGTLFLVVLVFLNDTRGWLRGLSLFVLAMVITQGVMGGLRVTEISTELAIVHGVFSQLVFTTIVLLASFTTIRWLQAVKPIPHESTENDRALTLALPIMLVTQLFLGASLRHLQVPTADGQGLVLPQWALHLHITMGVIAFAAALLVGFRAWGAYSDIPLISRLGKLIAIVVSIQFLLGLLALVTVLMRSGELPPPLEVISTSIHQATGAVLLVLAFLLCVWHRRLVCPVPPAR